MSAVAIIEATNSEDYAAGESLIKEYAAALGVDLCFQNFSEEIANLPRHYGPPHGCLLLARIGGATVGCVAVRYQGDAVCEMKRLFVKPEYRACGLARRMAEAAIERAWQLGYTRMVLHTLPAMTAAQALYLSLGFREVEGYYTNPLQGVRYLARELTESEQDTA